MFSVFPSFKWIIVKMGNWCCKKRSDSDSSERFSFGGTGQSSPARTYQTTQPNAYAFVATETRTPPVQQIQAHPDTTKTPVDSLKLLDIGDQFKDLKYKPEDFGVDGKSLEYMEHVRKVAETFEPKVNSFHNVNYSVEFFVLDESLMNLIEEVDKVKCGDVPEILSKKVEVIEYVRGLHVRLDANAIQD